MTSETSGEQITKMLYAPSPGEEYAGAAQASQLQQGNTGLSRAEAVRRAQAGLPVDYKAMAQAELDQITNLPTSAAKRQALGLGLSYVDSTRNPYNWNQQDPSARNSIYEALLTSGGRVGTPADIAAAQADQAEEQQAINQFLDKRVKALQDEVTIADKSPAAQLQKQLNDYIQQFTSQVAPRAIDATNQGLSGLMEGYQNVRNAASKFNPLFDQGITGLTEGYQNIRDSANKLGPASLALQEKILGQGIQATPEEIAAINQIADAAQSQANLSIDRYGQNAFRAIIQGMPERNLFGELNPETGKYQFSADIPDRFQQVNAELQRQHGNVATQLAQFRGEQQLQYPLQARPTMMGLAQSASVPQAFLSSMGAGGELANAGQQAFLSSMNAGSGLAQAGQQAYQGVLPGLSQSIGNQNMSGQMFTDLNTMQWLGLQPTQSVYSSLLQPRMAQMSTGFNQTQGGTLAALQASARLAQGVGGMMYGGGSMMGGGKK